MERFRSGGRDRYRGGAQEALFTSRPASLLDGFLYPPDPTKVRREAKLDKNGAGEVALSSAAALQSLIDAIPEHVSLLNADAEIVALNGVSDRFSSCHGLFSPRLRLGQNYLQRCRGLVADSADAKAVEQGIGSLLEGKPGVFEHVFQVSNAKEAYDCRIAASPFEHADVTFILVSHYHSTEARVSHAPELEDELALLDEQEGERRRIAQYLHDLVAPNLVAAQLEVSTLRSLGWREAGEEFFQLKGLLSNALNGIRCLSYLLHPPEIEELGLQKAVASLLKGFTMRTGINTHFDQSELPRWLGREAELAVYSVIQEALVNAYRHAKAKTIDVRLEAQSDGLLIEVKDDGVGIPLRILQQPALATTGLGLRSMRSRLKALHGSLAICRLKKGTKITARVPRPSRARSRSSSQG